MTRKAQRPSRFRAMLLPLAATLAVSLVLRVGAAQNAAAPHPPATEGARRLAGRAIGNTPLPRDLEELCDRIGGRPTGSVALKRAIDWAAKKFRDAGVPSVTLEPFEVPNLWLGKSTEGACLSPEPFALRLVAAPYSPSTPGGRPIEARLVDAGSGSEEEFSRLGADARGAVALVKNPEMRSFADLFDEYLKNSTRLEAAKKAGVIALLLQSSRPRGLLYRHPMTVDGTFASLPAAIVSREHASRLARLVEAGEVRVRLALVNETGGPYESSNVIAEIRGTEKADEIVLLGAHLDSWDLGTGAEDDGVNVAMVIDVARGFAELGIRPRRTVRFALFTGEEQGMWGSVGYVKRHAAEMGRHVMVVIFDIGSGRTLGFYLNGRGELRGPVDEALGVVAGLGSAEHSLEAIDGTDNFDFLLSGVPNLVAAQDPAPYLDDYHAESDTIDHVNLREARTNAAIASVLLFGLAESKSPPPPRQTRAEVEKLLLDTHLVEQMKAFGQWEGWVAGRRGVHP